MSFKTVDLFGGAMQIQVPASFDDVSTLRDVPDHQEVFCDRQGDDSLIVELLGYEDDIDNGDAAAYFFAQLAKDNEAKEAGVMRVDVLAESDVPGVPASPFRSLLVGRQAVAKFNEAATNVVEIYVANVRLPAQTTDVLITYNRAVVVNPESSSATSMEKAYGKDSLKITPEDQAQLAVKTALASFTIRDFSLFG